MKLIKKVEIKYLRSLYSCSIKQAGDLNIIFGRNDSGKSNFLRALNLFFNEETDPHTKLDFSLDMSDHRRRIARDTKGRQFIWIKVTFNVPKNYQAALGKEIQIKKQWNRDGGLTTTESPKLTTPGKQARLSRFINEIGFMYVPAIKDLSVYADLVEKMYRAAAEQASVKAAVTDFVEAVSSESKLLSKEIQVAMGMKSSISAPTDLSALFRNLDFSVGNEGHSLFRQKGDGIKARHIPEILRFIDQNESRKKFHIWGIEEPENSLDLSAASDEAERFASIASEDSTQVFVTSHSPAFYLAESNSTTDTRRIFISKQEPDGDDSMLPVDAASVIDSIEAADTSMRNAGLFELPHVIGRLKGLREQVNQAEAQSEALKKRIEENNSAKLFVEGKLDKWLIESRISDAFEALPPIQVETLEGTPHTLSAFIRSVAQKGGLNGDARSMFLFDNDQSGRRAFRNLCPDKSIAVSDRTTVAHNVYAMCLDASTEEFNRFTSDVGLDSNEHIFEIEFLFDPKISAKILDELLEDDADERDLIHEQYFNKPQKKVLKLQDYAAGTPGWFYARTVPDRYKKKFLKKILKKDNDLTRLDSLIRTIGEALVG